MISGRIQTQPRR